MDKHLAMQVFTKVVKMDGVARAADDTPHQSPPDGAKCYERDVPNPNHLSSCRPAIKIGSIETFEKASSLHGMKTKVGQVIEVGDVDLTGHAQKVNARWSQPTVR